MNHVKFTHMQDGDKEDYAFITNHKVEYTNRIEGLLLSALVDLDKGLSGYRVTRLGHSIQSATPALNDVADVDWIVSALLHDISDIYTPYNHDEYAGSTLRFIVREQRALVVEKYDNFQMVYYRHHVGDTRTSANPEQFIPISMIAPHFVNTRINPVLTLNRTANCLNFLLIWCEGSLPAPLMIHTLSGQACENLW